MSASLVRRGLELLNDDIKVSSRVKKKQQTPSSATVMDLVSTKRQGVTKQVKRLQGRLGPRKSKATVKDKRIRSAVEDFRKNQPKSQLNANLKYFLETTGKVEAFDAKKILKHSRGRQSRNHPDKPVEKSKEAQSLFTEEEFQQFQREYFGRTVEGKK
ncbi:ribosomal protein S19 binding protein 1 isoform X2 [Gambusia affinis]|uniref:ribosomal protein S19 binding protein 1 isoform X2 n=1 Tax=Gambusia affinis TaxID=33528 RepID=UPI001CDBEBD9|nr:ribosomal protein S19 binding protein 1 isoform X2 [Gambusia affinis]